MNRLIHKAILAWQSFLARMTRNTDRVLPDVAKNRQEIAIGRRHHRATRAAVKAQRDLINSALRGDL